MGSETMEPTVIRGSSEPYGSWKMICILRRILRSSPGLSDSRSTPSKRTEPLVASRSRIIARPMVLLPQPDSPTRPSVSPRRTWKVTPSTALTDSLVVLKMPARTWKWTLRSSTSMMLRCSCGVTVGNGLAVAVN